MNIFALDKYPNEAAKMHCDKHVVKMILESAQILSTANHLLADHKYEANKLAKLYKPTHAKHPSVKWTCENTANYSWLVQLYHWLGEEYHYRYGKRHKSMDLYPYLQAPPLRMDIEHQHTPFALAMPDQYKYFDDPVDSYRMYYAVEKKPILTYKKRRKPRWLVELLRDTK